MNKLLLKISALLSCLILIFYGVLFTLDTPYRTKLPVEPDLKNVSPALRHQIKIANIKTYLYPCASNLGNLGMIYHSSAFDEKAITCYQLAAKKVIQQNKRQWIWSYYLGCLDMQQGESRKAVEDFKFVLDKNPMNYNALFYTGEAYQNLGLTANAAAFFRKIASSDEIVSGINREFYFPLQTYAKFRLARIFLNSNQLDSAETILKETIKRQWTFGPAYRLLADVYAKQSKPDLSKKFKIRSNDLAEYAPPVDTLMDKIALVSRSEKYLLKQIEVAKMSYNFKWELTLCDHSMKFIPNDKYLLSNTILLYFILDKNKEVLPLLDRHLKFYGDDFDEMIKLADLLHGKSLDTQAMNYFNQAKKLQPGSSRLALWLQSAGKNDEAVSLLKDQLSKNPDNERILADAVHFYLNSDDKGKAIQYLNHLKNLYPSDVDALKATALLDEEDGKSMEAQSIFEAISKSEQKDLITFKYLSSIYFKEKLWDKAILNFRSALDKFPNDPDILDELGRLLISCPDPKFRNVDEGREYCERSYINFQCPPPTRIMAAKNLATAYAMIGDKTLTLRFIKITLDLAGQIGNRVNISQTDLISYFDNLKQQYHI